MRGPSTESYEDSGIPNLKYKKEFITKESDAKLKDRYQRVNSRYRDSQESFRNRQNYQETVYGLPAGRNVKYNPVGEFFFSIINYFRFHIHNQEIFLGFKFRFQMKIIKFSKHPEQPQSRTLLTKCKPHHQPDCFSLSQNTASDQEITSVTPPK